MTAHGKAVLLWRQRNCETMLYDYENDGLLSGKRTYRGERRGVPVSVITAEKLTGQVGAAVVGVDRDRLLSDDALPAWTLQALEEHGVLVFPGLGLDDATQVAFSKKLGRVETFGGPDSEFPEIFRVTLDPTKNKSARYLKGTFDWHIDGMTDDIPIMATLLSAHVLADSGGETEFASAYHAYESLTDAEKEEFEQLSVVHTIEAAQRSLNPSEKEREHLRQRPSKTHPLVWTHASGRKSLVLGVTADHVVGMEPEESEAFLIGLLERVTAPERVYRHSWTVGDLVIWDNRGVLHRVCPYDESSPRDMHRTTLHGDEAVQ
jgi:alpha-ketoglutarate-dependent taurine dioxygenase